jgi:hypothetical protein
MNLRSGLTGKPGQWQYFFVPVLECTKPGCQGKFVAATPVEKHQFGEVIYSKTVCDTCGLVAWKHPDEANSFAASV